jgi:putative ABC transport system substrate-binding protein
MTKTIPIIMTTQVDPVATGLIDSLARPGGNITGFSTLQRDLSGKRLELLKEVVPGLSRIALLHDRDPKSTPSSWD